MKEQNQVKEHNENVFECGCGHCSSHSEHKSIDSDKGFLVKYGFSLLKIFASIVLIVLGSLLQVKETFNFIIFVCSAFISGYELVINFFKNIFKGEIFNENALMLVATITAFILKEYFEGAMIVVLFSIGELLESIATDNSRKKIAGLSKLKSNVVHLITKNGIIEVDPKDVEVGSLIEVKSGESVPIDSILVGLPNEFDVKAITGESKFSYIENGGEVFSGSINVGNPVVVKTTKLYKDSTVERIISMVEGAVSKKANSQKFITSFAKIYTPLVFIVALMVAFLPPLFDGYNFVKWIYKSLSFLVISCPCALVISIPLSYFVGIGALAKRGVLVKGSCYIESLTKIQTVVFDKTGTLTYGNFKIEKIDVLNQMTESMVLEYACALEQYSNHPIAKAFIKINGKKKIQSATKVEELIGKGILGEYNGKKVCLGNQKLANDLGVVIESENYAGTVLYLIVDKFLCAKIYITDEIKENAKKSISALKKLGVKQTIILSGDKEEIAQNVGEKVGVDKVYAQLLPEQKAEKLKQIIKDDKNCVMYVGDGINDSPSLAISNVGVAMGGLGSEIAMSSADVVVMDDNLLKLSESIIHAKKIKRTVLQNIVGSLLVKFSIMLLSVFITLPVFIAMFADVGVMLVAVLNSLKNNKVKLIK